MKTKAARVENLPSSAQHVIKHYFNLQINNKKIPSPYYTNEKNTGRHKRNYPVPSDIDRFKKKNTKRRALVGKGSPGEIEKIVRECGKKYNFALDKASKRDIRDFMEIHGIGIDCSGFVVWILNEVFKEKYQKPIWSFIDMETNSLIRKALFKLRPIENISVRVLTKNSNSVRKISDVQVGDLVITRNGEHVLLITKVAYDKNNRPIYFEYVNSTWWYGKENGVRKGSVEIINPGGYLMEQNWKEDFDKNTNWTFEGVKNNSKIVRLKRISRV